MTLFPKSKPITGNVCWMPYPDIYTRKQLDKIKGKCCDSPDWNDCCIDCDGNPYIKCENCESMCFD